MQFCMERGRSIPGSHGRYFRGNRVLEMFAAASLWTRRIEMPEARQLPLMVLACVFDTGGNVFHALEAHEGRLDVAAILTSMHPAATVLPAWILLKERLSHRQWPGVFSVLAAVVMIA
jgi:drug/metabolite transporter (DMT)-like permease